MRACRNLLRIETRPCEDLSVCNCIHCRRNISPTKTMVGLVLASVRQVHLLGLVAAAATAEKKEIDTHIRLCYN